MKEGEPKRVDYDALLKKIKKEAFDFGNLIPSEEIIAVEASESEEAFAYGTLDKDGGPLKAEGRVISNAEGKPLLTLPNPELVESLHTADRRIESFDSSLLKLSEDGHLLNWSNNEDYEYYKRISAPLAAQVMKEFPNEEALLARGIAASLNGAVTDGNALLVRDIRHVLHVGNEIKSPGTLMASVGIDEENMPFMHHRINQYLISGQWGLRRKLPSESAKNIFPVLLVYDKSKVQAGGGYYYALPDDEASREACILKAYILPRPEV